MAPGGLFLAKDSPGHERLPHENGMIHHKRNRPCLVQEPLWPETLKKDLPSDRDRGPKINKDDHVPRDQEISKGRFPRG